MLREDEIRILHIVEACEAVLRYVSGQRQEDLQADDMRARAVIQAIGVIGRGGRTPLGRFSDAARRHTVAEDRGDA